MRILGINAFGHDAAAVLLVDGQAVFASSQERFDRQRHSAAFPGDAIEAALESAGIAPGDLDAVAFPWHRGMGRLAKAWHLVKGLPRSLAYFREPPDTLLPDRRSYLSNMVHVDRRLERAGLAARLIRVPHHEAHAVSATLGLPGGAGAVLTADGMGEWTTAATWTADGSGVSRRDHASYPHSVGKAYAAATAWLGFVPESDEGKTMGLAAYGDPDAPGAQFARGLLSAVPRGLVRVDTSAFGFPWGEARLYGDAFIERLGPARAPDEPLRDGDADVARGVQDAVEAFALETAKRLLRDTGATALGLAGGLFLNCAMNGRLARELDAAVCPFPVAGDAGAAWGAAAWAHTKLTGDRPAALDTLLLGHAISSDAAAPQETAEAMPRDALAKAVATSIAAGRVVGVARGRAELGPRALGARSVFASPTTTERRDDVNARKGREAWRPLAPIVREDDTRWFEPAMPSPYMILTGHATPLASERVPGVVHADGTARVQTVSRAAAPFVYDVLDALEALGEPAVVINTSLNRRGEPIVNTADQALTAARAMGLDELVLGDALLRLGDA